MSRIWNIFLVVSSSLDWRK